MEHLDGAVLRRADGVLEQELDGELLLLRAGSSSVLHLDPVATQVWRLLDQPLDLETLTACLSASYRAPEPTVARDLRPALALLLEHGLLVRS